MKRNLKWRPRNDEEAGCPSTAIQWRENCEKPIRSRREICAWKYTCEKKLSLTKYEALTLFSEMKSAYLAKTTHNALNFSKSAARFSAWQRRNSWRFAAPALPARFAMPALAWPALAGAPGANNAREENNPESWLWNDCQLCVKKPQKPGWKAIIIWEKKVLP